MTDFDPERERLHSAGAAYKTWGPYLSERQWGTVREDYSEQGRAWDYFPHDQARSRAYRWGEDGIGGLSDDMCRLCVSVALWNGNDPILKERLFGLTNSEGNHGEDVKEAYYYLDATPTHSYLRMLYKYPQRAFPYDELVKVNAARTREEREYELVDTGVFDDDRYFDVEIEYARAGPDDILLSITAHNRGPDPAPLTIVPQVWFRNTWSWSPGSPRPRLYGEAPGVARAIHAELGEWVVEFADSPELCFTDNDTNSGRLFDSEAEGFFKDGIGEYVVSGDTNAINPAATGTKMGGVCRKTIPAGGSAVVRLRLRRPPEDLPETPPDAWSDFDAIVTKRRSEADLFYATLQRDIESADARAVQRQAFAGMIWTKQFYYYDVHDWLEGDPHDPAPQRKVTRNEQWRHVTTAEVISMPDAWEYPWYAAWDLAFHCIPLALVDPKFAKGQLELLTREWYMHPNGQLPAYEWAFDDVNPPVHAWATWRVYQIDRKHHGGAPDTKFLERVFHKLLLNFTWWVNRKDHEDNNVFQGGFLGLDNIGVFDRSKGLPSGARIDQADGTAWMAMYSLNMMRIAIELALHNDVYEDIATKFFEHFLYIAKAMFEVGETGLWDDDDKFYYDWLALPGRDGHDKIPLRVRSMVGLIPLFAVEVLDPATLDRLPRFKARLEWFLENRPDLAALISHWEVPGVGQRRLLSLLRGHRMKRLIKRMVDETEFLSPYGVRSMSRVHLDAPFRFEHDGQEHVVQYTPAESDSNLFGGNSNWRGPVWFPVNFLLIESLQRFHYYYGDEFVVEFPTGSGELISLDRVAEQLGQRLTRLFLRNEDGRRPVFGDDTKHQTDPHFRDHILFYEYFDGDNGRGVGASHQTGWTALVAKLIQPRRREPGGS